MVETLQDSGLWHIVLAQKDLIEQGGLKKENFKQDLGSFMYKERRVIMSHKINQHLVVSIEGEENQDTENLIRGFSKVVEYEPFCKYILMPIHESIAPPLLTYEWDKVDPDSRYKKLSHKDTTLELEKLV